MEVDKESNDLVREKGGPEAMKEKGKIYVHEEGTRLGAPMRCSALIRAWHALTPYTAHTRRAGGMCYAMLYCLISLLFELRKAESDTVNVYLKQV